MKTTTLNIEGMHCDGCARTVDSLLSRVAGVKQVEVCLEEGRARILFDQNLASETDLKAAAGKGGFTVDVADP